MTVGRIDAVSEAPAKAFLECLEPLVQDGNTFACAYKLRMLGAGEDVAAQQAVVDDLTAKMQGVVDVMREFAGALTRAFSGINMAALAERLVTAQAEGIDQLPYDDAPEACWATSTEDDEEACNLAAIDDLGLCEEHRARMVL